MTWARAKGVQHGRAKLTDDEVISLRHQVRTGSLSKAKAARTYNISRRQVGRICSGEHWPHVSTPMEDE